MENKENQMIKSEEMVVNIDNDRTDIMVIFDGKIVALQTCTAGIRECKDSIADYMRNQYTMAIDEVAAGRLLEQVGAVIRDLENPPAECEVAGTDLVTGAPMTVKVGHREMAEALDPAIGEIERRILRILETTPAGYSYNLYNQGFKITGNVAGLRGLEQRFSKLTSLKVEWNSVRNRNIDDKLYEIMIF